MTEEKFKSAVDAHNDILELRCYLEELDALRKEGKETETYIQTFDFLRTGFSNENIMKSVADELYSVFEKTLKVIESYFENI